jgi:hypothetical protein
MLILEVSGEVEVFVFGLRDRRDSFGAARTGIVVGVIFVLWWRVWIGWSVLSRRRFSVGFVVQFLKRFGFLFIVLIGTWAV